LGQTGTKKGKEGRRETVSSSSTPLPFSSFSLPPHPLLHPLSSPSTEKNIRISLHHLKRQRETSNSPQLSQESQSPTSSSPSFHRQLSSDEQRIPGSQQTNRTSDQGQIQSKHFLSSPTRTELRERRRGRTNERMVLPPLFAFLRESSGCDTSWKSSDGTKVSCELGR